MKSFFKNMFMTLFVVFVAAGINWLFGKIFNSESVITAVFMLSVLIVALNTSGYVYGIISSLLVVLCINYAFREPYFKFDFTLGENIVNAVAILIISIVSGALAKRIKKYEKEKAEIEAEKLRADLLRAVSHDLRTPLTSIFGAGTTIYENYELLPEEEKKLMLKGIAEDSEWLIHMVENLLSVTKAGTAEVNIVKFPVVLEELVDSVIGKFKKRYPGIDLKISLPEDIVIFSADPILIEQVILNLLENAVKHAVGMENLKLTIYTDEEKINFVISDDGCGMEKAHIKNIFSGIFNFDSTYSDNNRNMGIGLSACNAILKAHGSNLKASNIKPHGMKFYFTLIREEL